MIEAHSDGKLAVKAESSRREAVSIDCYSQGERAAMDQGRALRARLLRPLLAALTRVRMTADGLTAVSLVAGLSFVPLWLVGMHWQALVALTAHVILDGLDGPLARFQGHASNAGSFTDTMADQTVIAATTCALVAAGMADAVAGTVYVVVYTAVVLFAFLRNALDVPYAWLFRPRFAIYAWIAIDAFLWPGTMSLALWLATALLAVKLGSGFVRIRARLR